MINGTCFKNAIISGANNLFKHKTHVDELNIFPVPDGDTGTNMSMSIGSSVEALKNVDSDSVKDVVKTAMPALLLGARGNSGTILSILFKGFSKMFSDLDEISGQDIVSALSFGVESAYNTVMKPTEGTILTVARVASERAKAAVKSTQDAIEVWSEVCKGAWDALKTTPDLLPVLKKAGVVDAGGKGLCLIFDGMLSVFKDGVIIESDVKPADLEHDDAFKNAVAEFDGDINFTYCTEYIIKRSKTAKSSPLKLRRKLEKIGDCVLVVDDDEIVKVHVHTENPGIAQEEGLKLGQLLTVKVDNLKEQHREAVEVNRAKLAKEKENEDGLTPQEPVEEVGFVAVAAGGGLVSLFKDLGCGHVISGGQTMNPSTEKILEAILATPAKTVYVFPNNKNIIMSAEQTIPLATDRTIVIIPTKTIAQGISAMLAYDPDIDAETNAERMKSSAAKVATGQITFAARDSDFGGFKIKERDILALSDGKLVFTEKDPVKAAARLAKSMVKKNTEFITLIYGESISLEQAEKAKSMIQSLLKHEVDITLVNGEQPIYHFIISVE